MFNDIIRRRRRAWKSNVWSRGNTVSKLVFYYPRLMIPPRNEKKILINIHIVSVLIRSRSSSEILKYFRVFIAFLYFFFDLFIVSFTLFFLSRTCFFRFLSLSLPATRRDFSCFIFNDVQILRVLISFNAIANHREAFFSPHNYRRCKFLEQCRQFP